GRGTNGDLPPVPAGTVPRRLYSSERRRDSSRRQQPHLCRACRRQRSCERRCALVPQFKCTDRSGRYRGRAPERGAHTGAAAVAGDYADPVQRGDRYSGCAFALTTREVVYPGGCNCAPGWDAEVPVRGETPLRHSTCREVPRGEGVRWGGRADRSPVSRVSEIGTHGLNGGSDSGSPWLQWSKVLPMCRPLERNSCTICRSGLL